MKTLNFIIYRHMKGSVRSFDLYNLAIIYLMRRTTASQTIFDFAALNENIYSLNKIMLVK